MSGPWEQFSAPSTPPPAEGPWSKFKDASPPAPPVDRSRSAAAIPTAADEGKPAPGTPTTLTNPEVMEAGTRAERMRAQPPSFVQNVTGAIEAGLNLATVAIGGAIGMPVGAGIHAAEGLGLKSPTGPGGKPIGLDPAMAETTAGVTGALKNATLIGSEPDSDVGAEYTENVGQKMVEHAPAFMGIAPEVAMLGRGMKGLAQGGRDLAAARAAPAVAERAKTAALEAPVLKGVAEAHAAGYTLPPSATKQGGATGATATGAEGLSGAPTLNKSMSKKNAEVTNKLVREDVGLPEDEPVSRAALARVRAEAGEKYAVLKQIDTIENDAKYTADLDEITKSYDTAAKDFPHRSENPFQKVIDGLRQEKMSGAGAVEEVKLLRADADKAYRTGDKGLGRAYKAAAEALDSSIDRHLTKMVEQGADPALADAVTQYRAARKQIAKTYLADAALNDTTGNVNAAAYARALDRKAPLDGPALTIARAAKQFPEVFKQPEKIGATGGPGVADVALSMLGKGKLDLATVGARPVARAALQSKPVQSLITKRARDASKAAEAKPPAPPPEPTTSPGAGGPSGGGEPPKPGPLGDLTPDWETTPGAGGGKPRGGEEPGLVRAVDEPEPTTGNRKAKLEIPAVPGRPDLPDALVAGGPAEVAATERANRAMNEPGAIEARTQQAEAAERARRAAEPRVPVGETKEGQPPIKADKTGKVPVGKVTEGQPEIKPLVPKKPIKAGEATELPVEKIEPEAPIDTGEVVPLTPEQEKTWRREFGLGDGDAERAKAVAVALRHDAPAVEKAAVQFDNQPRAFDREIARITDEGEARANEVKQAADSGEGDGATGSDGTEPNVAAATEASGERGGAERAAAPAAGGEQAPAGGQTAAGAVGERVLASTKPISHEEALKLVAGKTDKPGGVDPAKMLGASVGNGRELRHGDVPLDAIRENEDGARYDSTVDMRRAAEYAEREGTMPPVLLVEGRSGGFNVNDGGHRVTAARLRGDKTISAIVGMRKADGVEIREVPGGFEAWRDGKKVGYLKDNLERGQAKQLGESANVDMVKVDKDEQGKGTGRALYAAFAEKHEGAIAPSGKTEPSAWKLWKRNYPEKVDAFVKQEAARIADGADPGLVARNITDPEVRSRVLKESEDAQRLQPDDLQPAAKEEGVQKGGDAEPPEEVFSTSIEDQQKAVADYRAGKLGGKPVGSPERMREVLADKFGAKLVDGLIEQGLLKFALSLDEGMSTDKGRRGVKAVFRSGGNLPESATLYFDRITEEHAPALLMHELGEHFGAPRLLGQERYNLVMGELKTLAESDPEVKAAWKHVEDNYIGPGTPDNVKLGDDRFMREVAAHLVETQPDLPWVRRLVNEIRAFFYEHFGTTMGNRVDANLIRGMAAAALRRASTGGLAGQRPTPRQFKPFVPSRTAMGSSEKRPPTQ